MLYITPIRETYYHPITFQDDPHKGGYEVRELLK